MKTTKTMMTAIIVALVTTILANGNVYGQKGKKTNCPYNQEQVSCKFISDLTQEQQDKIDALRTQHLKNSLSLNNELNEKEARYKTLMTEEKPDMAAINNLIDEIVVIKGKLLKQKAQHQQEIRKVLNDGQRVLFDQRLSIYGKEGYGRGNCPNEGKGQHRGM